MQELEFMWAGGYTRRYHTMRLIGEDTVGHHSYNVACIIMYLRPKASAALLRAALKHDMAEHVLGDLPAPTKRKLPDFRGRDDGDAPTSFRDMWQYVEDSELGAAGVGIEELTQQEKYVLKLADAMDGMRFCIQERQMGNQLIAPVYENFQSYVSELLWGRKITQMEEYASAPPLAEQADDIDLRTYRQLKHLWMKSTREGDGR